MLTKEETPAHGTLSTEQLARAFLECLVANDPARYAQILTEDAGLRAWGWDGTRAHRPRDRVVRALTAEWSAWPDPSLEVLSVLPAGDRVALEYRIQATENGRYVEHNRAAFLTLRCHRIQTIDLYCPEPLPSARRNNYIAPATSTEPQIQALLRDFQNTIDIREYIMPGTDRFDSLRIRTEGSGDPHPGSNEVRWAMWTAEEADRRIEVVIDDHRRRDIGFLWFTGPYDSPPDLGERLRNHGLIRAGDNVTMMRVGLENPDIPVNPDLESVLLDASTDEDTEAALQVSGRCFNWTSAQIDDRRLWWVEQVKGPTAAHHLLYLGKHSGRPVAFGHMVLKNGIAFMAGAGTLPDYRSQKVYSTLLRQRLVDAAARGYRVAVIYAGPMSRRVAVKYGFRAYNQFDIYAWMPEVDMAVIRSLIVDE